MDVTNAKLYALSAEIAGLARVQGVERLVRAREMTDRPGRLLWSIVGAVTADMLYLEGLGYREIAEEISQVTGEPLTAQGAKHFLDRFGPPSYWLIRQRADGTGYDTYEYRLRTGEVRQQRPELASYLDGGYRAVPAAWLIDDPADAGLDRIWRRLEQPRAARNAFAAT